MDIKFKNLVFDILADNTDLGIAVIDKEGHFIFYNNEMGSIEGLKKEDVISKHIFDIYPSFGAENSTIYRCLNSGVPTFRELQSYINNDRKKILSLVTDIPIVMDGNIVGAVEIARNFENYEKNSHSVKTWLSGNNQENSKMKKTAYYSFENFRSKNEETLMIVEKAKRISKHDANVLIFGETGTGKEIIAQGIHSNSKRSAKAFIAQNCAAIPENLLESILFGTMKGSFTGAIDKAGLFEQASGGTLLLDELNSLPIFLQAKLLRVLQEKQIRRLGGNTDLQVDVRVIATVNADPMKLVKEGKLREDLFYRLSTMYVFIPPLRSRTEDILFLSGLFISEFSDKFKFCEKNLSEEVREVFQKYDWRGNVRELINVVEYAVLMSENEKIIDIEHLPEYFQGIIKKFDDHIKEKLSLENYPYEVLIEEFERKIILDELLKNDWNITKTAMRLNIKRQTLHNKIKKMNITRKYYF